MSLQTGTRLGVYEVISLVGVGGMGEVYRARDTKLNRDVAIKVLPETFAADPERLARFKREAQVLASLNHPNIAAIYGLEESGPSAGSGQAVSAIVMELVEGPTLGEILSAHGSGLTAHAGLSPTETLPIARQITEALEAAHEQGVVHRDLKPANIKVRPDGVVKVLDFGLAAVMQTGSSADAQMTNSPTLSMQATRAGMILGTAGYMSPEQASGRAVDKRADIWAFGVVLYELVTGKRLFEGETIAHTLADVLRGEIDFGKLPADTPVALGDLIHRCLDRNAKSRLRDIGEARIVLEHAIAHPEAANLANLGNPANLGNAANLERWWRRALPWAVAGAAVVSLGVVLAVWRPWRMVARPPEMRLEIITPATTDPLSFALSPDGTQLVFVASGDGPSRLWLRSLSATAAQPLPGTEGAAFPFWSPNSRSVAFFGEGRLARLDLGTGRPQTLATVQAARGGTWNADGTILFTRSAQSTLVRMAASGGEPVAVTKLDPGQTSHRWPQFLPDGRRFVYYAMGTPETAGIYLGSLGSEEPRRLAAADTAAVYAPSGWLLWGRAGTLVAQRLDLQSRALLGDPLTVADQVGFDGNGFSGAFSASAAGLIAYRPTSASRRQLQWFDRAGKLLGAMGAPDDGGLSSPRVSPDGRRVAVWRSVQSNSDIWLLDGTRATRFTFDAASDRYPIWSPDGSQIAFDSNRKGTRNLYVGLASSPGSETLLLESPQDKYVSDWSPDGRVLLYGTRDPKADWDQWMLPLGGDKKPWPFLNTNFLERIGTFSADGRWVAYQTNQSGRPEIYVRSFTVSAPAAVPDRGTPNPGGQWQVSTAGGIYPRWRADGKELYFIAPDGRMMAAPILVTGATMEPGTPVALFQTRIYGGGTENAQGWQYDVARDGRFLINTALDDASAPITLLLNWNPQAK